VPTTESLREQAARLHALAKQARETGNIAYADLLTEAAAEYFSRAIAAEAASPAKTPTHDGPPTLQQQQIQPKQDKQK
jgi:hypothetical protein